MSAIPELLAQAMIVDRKCKNMAGELGARAHSMAQAARKEDSPTRRRTIEVLANHLNEQAGKLRFSPRPDDYEMTQKSLTEEVSDELMKKGLQSTVYLEDDSNLRVGKSSVLAHEAEYGPEVGWTFFLGRSPSTDYSLFVCKSFGEIIRSYLVPSEVLVKHVEEGIPVEVDAYPAEVNIPVFDADWVQYRHNWSPLEADSQ